MSYFVSPAVVVTALVGGIIAVFYLTAMARALGHAIKTRFDEEPNSEDVYGRALGGAVLAVGLSIVAIASYGFGSSFLYLGPALALASPVAVTYCLRQEVGR